MSDTETISVYDQKSEDYKACFASEKPDRFLTRLVSKLPENSFVLDLGCGPGHASSIIKEYGHKVDPVDASTEMVKIAKNTYSVAARQATFFDIKGKEIYDAIWANFSLLHAPRKDIHNIFKKLTLSLKPNGIMHLGLKLKVGEVEERRDRLGRFYSYYSEDELNILLKAQGFEILATNLGSGVGLAGAKEPWIVILARKI